MKTNYKKIKSAMKIYSDAHTLYQRHASLNRYGGAFISGMKNDMLLALDDITTLIDAAFNGGCRESALLKRLWGYPEKYAMELFAQRRFDRDCERYHY